MLNFHRLTELFVYSCYFRLIFYSQRQRQYHCSRITVGQYLVSIFFINLYCFIDIDYFVLLNINIPVYNYIKIMMECVWRLI